VPITVLVLELVLELVLLWLTVTLELFDEDASPVVTLLPPAAELLAVDVLAAVAEPPAPPVAVVELAESLPDPVALPSPPSPELIAAWPVQLPCDTSLVWVLPPLLAAAV